MIELLGNTLVVRFPEVHRKAQCTVEFQRTLRVPDDGKTYPLPAGLGAFRLHSVDDHPVPEHWKSHGGVFMPMYQSEAMWISFRDTYYPFAVKVAAGKVNAVTGAPWSNSIARDPQDYLVLPGQLWLDGFHVTANEVRQFVAEPLGEGLTAEEQITGAAQWGGLQLAFYPMKAEVYERLAARQQLTATTYTVREPEVKARLQRGRVEQGLAPGGRIHQQIRTDEHDLADWDTAVSSRCFVHLLNSRAYTSIVGQRPPNRPITATEYERNGIPWFDYYADGPAEPGSAALSKMQSVAELLRQRGQRQRGNVPIPIAKTIRIAASAGDVGRVQ